MAAACRVILVGMMGSGKSTIGRLLSKASGWPYFDNDDLVLRSHGATPRQLLAERGEAAMRAAESSALALGLEVPEPAIIGAAAGTILDERNRDRIRDGGIVVWLTAAPSVLAERATGSEHRPWLGGDAESWIREAAAERDPLYASAAHITLDTTSDPPEESALELRRRLESTGRCP
jgi:shikimate kinase